MKGSVLTLVVVSVLLSSCNCWWEMGHMLTAAVAQIKLKQANQTVFDMFNSVITSMNPLCPNTSHTLIESSVWPDDIKGTAGMTLWNDWHFIDSPYVYDGVVPIVNYSEAVSNSVYIVNQAKKVLATNINKLTAERALLARYLVHLAGDIHQPLHSVAFFNETYPKGDQGGNLLKIKLPGNTTLGNFHSYWDAGAYQFQKETDKINRPLNEADTAAMLAKAQDFLDEFKGTEIEELGKEIKPEVWALESFRVAQNTTYPHMLTTTDADPAYVTLTFETCKKRVVLGGLRLFNLVMNIYSNSTQLSEEPVQKLDDKWFFDRIRGTEAVVARWFNLVRSK